MSALAHWCTSRRKAVLWIWIVGLLALAGLAGVKGTAFSDAVELPDSESSTAYAILGEGGDGESATSGTIVWKTTGTAVDAASVRTTVTAMLAEIKAMPGVQAVSEGQTNKAANTAYARVVLTADADATAVADAARGYDKDGLDVEGGGTAFSEQPEPSHGTEAIGVLAALIILLLMFRSMWAAVLPILTGLVGVGASLLVVVLGAHVVDLSATSLTMGALIGLGVGIDYALFIVNRYRKALLAGATVRESVATAVNTSGRAVVFAGITVIVALLGMFVVDLSILTGMAQAAAVSVLFTVLTALTLLPALLAMLGTRVLSRRQRAAIAEGHLPATHRPRLAGRWAALIDRSPVLAAAGALLVIGTLAAPVLSLRVGDSDASSDPAGTATRAYYDMMTPAFGAGYDATLLLVARTPDAASATAFQRLVKDLPAVANVAAVSAAPAETGATVMLATVVPGTSAQTEQTADLVQQLRDDVIPGAETGSNLQVYVGGTTATSIDLSDALLGKLPLYLGLVALLGFLLLAIAFRSIVVPLMGALTNLATLLVGLGAITAIFQFGWGTELLGVGGAAPIMYFVPVIIVGVMFGLSMDYQVFLVSRMHEEHAHTHDNRHSIRTGLAETAQVIGAAAGIMLFVFASFGFTPQRIVSAIGIGLGIAVLIDAFVVRLTLIPALMRLVGDRNWWYPRWADKLTPNLSVEGPAQPVAAEPVPAAPEPVGTRF
ncbi:MMPL family transporter [Actinoplanes derwentensis]|uniref:Putative drug exporter of the RND superfamily n=1 Tax=Actinoplanes derwentensis TaxID=113562 RepID=A0A1H1R6S7_9ACTN|nr:MMPL family transporter [Actinoplanes derwentensis]GID88031.1 membrane protein [Actinoplanes derwentensis]SDS31438.1 putative drug exporter of the RND superfamily [Actinoplanes derwentensis]